MNGEKLLDTNIVIRLFARDPAIELRLDANSSVLLPIFVLGELYYGARKSARFQENVRKIDEFASRVEILYGDIDTARQFGAIKNELRLKGRMIPECDLWIAAIARQHDVTLASADQHFAEVENLRWEQW